MKALTVWEPWATFLVKGPKRYETRTWRTSHRGPLAIHAAKRLDPDVMERCFGAAALEDDVDVLSPRAWPDTRLCQILGGHGIYMPDGFHPGHVLGVVELVDVYPAPEAPRNMVERHLGDFGEGRFAWQVRRVLELDEPLPARGQQGLWRWDAPARVEEALAREGLTLS